MKRYLITGGTGFIGSAIVRKLITQGQKIKVFDNNYRGKLSRLSDVLSEVEFIEGDIRDKHAVTAAAKGVDAVIHLAYINGTKFFYSHPDLVLDVGIKGMLNVIDAGAVNNVAELYLASSSEVYASPHIIPTPENVPLIIPDPYNPRFSYSGGKIMSELMSIHMASKYFQKVIIFRPHNVYGPDMGLEHVIPEFINRMKSLKKGAKSYDFVTQGSGSESRAYIYIDDFVKGFRLLLNHKSTIETFNIGTDDKIAAKDLALLIAKEMGIKIIIIPGKLQEGSTLRRLPDISKLKKLGFQPKISLENGLKKTIQWYISH